MQFTTSKEALPQYHHLETKENKVVTQLPKGVILDPVLLTLIQFSLPEIGDSRKINPEPDIGKMHTLFLIHIFDRCHCSDDKTVPPYLVQFLYPSYL